MSRYQYCVNAVMTILCATAFSVAAQTSPLDGRVFATEGGVKDKPPSETIDIISFKDGKFHSSSCEPYGYGTGKVIASIAGDVVTFKATTESEKDGRLEWSGTVRGNDIEGTYVHYRKGWFLNPNPAPIDRWFKGKLKS